MPNEICAGPEHVQEPPAEARRGWGRVAALRRGAHLERGLGPERLLAEQLLRLLAQEGGRCAIGLDHGLELLDLVLLRTAARAGAVSGDHDGPRARCCARGDGPTLRWPRPGCQSAAGVGERDQRPDRRAARAAASDGEMERYLAAGQQRERQHGNAGTAHVCPIFAGRVAGCGGWRGAGKQFLRFLAWCRAAKPRPVLRQVLTAGAIEQPVARGFFARLRRAGSRSARLRLRVSGARARASVGSPIPRPDRRPRSLCRSADSACRGQHPTPQVNTPRNERVAPAHDVFVRLQPALRGGGQQRRRGVRQGGRGGGELARWRRGTAASWPQRRPDASSTRRRRPWS
jgi:hypothetical protein